MFTIHSQEMYDKDDSKQDLQDALTLLVRMYSPEDVLELLAKAYQSKRDIELQNWFDYGGKKCAVKAFKCDQISQKLLRVIRELEEK